MLKNLLLMFSLLTFAAEASIRIMPLGDSITYGDSYADRDNPRPAGLRHAYRNHLWYKLKGAGMDVDFVGSVIAGQDVQPPFDPDNEGHPGWTSYDIAEQAYSYMINSGPDMVLLHIGTNDRTTTDPEGVAAILNEIDQYESDSGHHVRVFVALIIDRLAHDGRIEIFNRRLKAMLEERIMEGDDIVIVDMYHGAGLTPSDYADNTHPNDVGYEKMARVWFNAIMQNKNYNSDIRAFPTSLVPRENIISVSYDDANGVVRFMVEIPDNGIQF